MRVENHPALSIHFNAVSYQTKGLMGKKYLPGLRLCVYISNTDTDSREQIPVVYVGLKGQQLSDRRGKD